MLNHKLKFEDNNQNLIHIKMMNTIINEIPSYVTNYDKNKCCARLKKINLCNVRISQKLMVYV